MPDYNYFRNLSFLFNHLSMMADWLDEIAFEQNTFETASEYFDSYNDEIFLIESLLDKAH